MAARAALGVRGAKPGSESDKMVRQGKCRQFSNIRASSGATRWWKVASTCNAVLPQRSPVP